MNKYEFTNTWFDENSLHNWNKILPIINPSKILEIGAYEGAATCYLIDFLGSNRPIEIHSVDVWEDYDYGTKETHHLIEPRFDRNVEKAIKNSKNKINFFKHKKKSHLALSEMIVNGVDNFDLIYIDASHYGPDVLTDAVLSFKLLKNGGLMIFDDYLWAGDENIVFYPKIAIDAFTTIFSSHIKLIPAPICQIYAVKLTLNT